MTGTDKQFRATLLAGDDRPWHKQPLFLISVGYPLLVFLLLAFQSTSHARSAISILAPIHLWLFRHFIGNTAKAYIHSPIILCGTAVIGYVTCSSLWSTPPFLHSEAEQFRTGAWVLVFWLLSCSYFCHISVALKCIFWTIGFGVFTNLAGTWIDLDGQIFIENRLTGQGILNNPIFLGSVAVIQITIGLNIKTTTMLERILTGLMLCASMALVVLSLSRGPIVALVATISVWFFWKPAVKPRHKWAIAILMTGAAGTILYITGWWVLILERGTSLRPLIWQHAMRAAEEHWLSGWGWANDFSRSPVNQSLVSIIGFPIIHPHGLLISSFYYGGIIGLLLHATLFLLLIRESINKNHMGFALGLIASMLLLTATDSFSAVTKRDYIWLIFWMPAAILYSLKFRNGNASGHASS